MISSAQSRGSWTARATFSLLVALTAIACSGGGAGGGGVDCEPRQEFLAVGDTVSDMVLMDRNGDSTSILDIIDGRVAVVDIWASWCQPCIYAMPHLESLHRQYADKGFTMVGVMVDGKAETIGPEFVAEREIGYPMLFDDDGNQLACDWGEVQLIPTIVAVNAEGTVLDVWMGTGDLSELDRLLEKIFGEPAEQESSEIL
jgi:thiol-disulfide isomerase/thioredoxin